MARAVSTATDIHKQVQVTRKARVVMFLKQYASNCYKMELALEQASHK